MAAAPQATTPVRKGFLGWLNKRMPVDEFVSSQLTGYYAPKNFNIWYFFGSLAMLVLSLLRTNWKKWRFRVLQKNPAATAASGES